MIIRSLPGPSIRLLCYFSTTRNLSFPSISTPSLLTLLSKSKSNPPLGGKLKVRLTTTHLSVRSMSSSSSSSSVFFTETEKKINLLTATEDGHGGVIVEMPNQPLDPAVFTSLLRASLSHWKLQGKKGVWIKVPIELVNLVEPAVKEGFYYHHAEPNYLMLVYWIPETANTLPVNASHRVGIGAFVMKENREVLVVQEKSGILRGSGIWKFPTGVVDEGEDICDAAVREVKEETGIDAKFVEILGFRQSHKSFFEKSDLFFMCMLQPLSFDIQMQESEIEAAEWMPFEKYAAQPFVQKHDLLKYIVDVCVAKMDKKYTGFSPVPTVSKFYNEKSSFYLNKQCLDSTRDFVFWPSNFHGHFHYLLSGRNIRGRFFELQVIKGLE